MDISYRLNQIADMVSRCNTVADIGTDHAYVPIKLVLEGKVQSALAMDIGQGPLACAKEHIAQYGLSERITCRLSDGLQQLHTEEADTIVIAGMGGELMSRICKHDEQRFFGNKEFILQPQSEYYKVRKQIHAMGYAIVEERNFIDEGKYYVCIKAQPGQETYENWCEYVYGKVLLMQKDSILKEYIHKKLKTLTQIEKQITAMSDQKEKSQNKLEEIADDKKLIQQALRYYQN